MNIVPGSPWVIDSRRFHARVFNQPELCTPSGRNPIKPTSIEIEYSITTGKVGSITVHGERVHNIGLTKIRRHGSTVSRRITDLDQAPEWVREIADAYRPVVPEVVDWLDGFDCSDAAYPVAMRLRAGLRGDRPC